MPMLEGAGTDGQPLQVEIERAPEKPGWALVTTIVVRKKERRYFALVRIAELKAAVNALK